MSFRNKIPFTSKLRSGLTEIQHDNYAFWTIKSSITFSNGMDKIVSLHVKKDTNPQNHSLNGKHSPNQSPLEQNINFNIKVSMTLMTV